MKETDMPSPPSVTPELVAELAAAYLPDGTIDLGRLVPLLHPEVVLHVPGQQPLAGDHHGLAEIAAFLMGSREVTAAGEHVDHVDTLVGADHVALLVRVTGERLDARRLDNTTVHLAHVDGAGLVTDIWFHNRDQAHVDAFWS